MSDRYPIKGCPGYYRDSKTNVVINTNNAEYDLILEKRKHEKEISEVSNEMNRLNKELEELKKIILGSKN